MTSHKIIFQHLSWETISSGARQKEFRTEDKRIRLLRLEDGFVEKEWCTSGHVGYVLDGEMILDFSGRKEEYKIGDAFLIERGEGSKHKAMVGVGGFVELLLIEEVGER